MDQGSAVVVGRLSRDPQFFGEGDKQRAVFSIAYNRGRDEKRKANFIDAIAWGKRADIMRDFTKGMGIFITGDLEQDSYENKEGVKVSRVQVNVNSITATTSTRRSDNEDATANAGGGQASGGNDRSSSQGSESAPIPF